MITAIIISITIFLLSWFTMELRSGEILETNPALHVILFGILVVSGVVSVCLSIINLALILFGA